MPIGVRRRVLSEGADTRCAATGAAQRDMIERDIIDFDVILKS